MAENIEMEKKWIRKTNFDYGWIITIEAFGVTIKISRWKNVGNRQTTE